MILGLILGVILFGVLFLYKSKFKIKNFKYVFKLSKPNLTNKEKEFLKLLNNYSSNNLINDGNANEVAYLFSKEWNDKNKIPDKHYKFAERSKKIIELGGLNPVEIYAGGFWNLQTSYENLLKSEKHEKAMRGNYTHIGISIVNKHYTAIYFNIK